MFGKHQTIISPEVTPAYFVDFRDYRGNQKPGDRWSDRVYPDGTWEANLLQFYERCQLKLYADLKVPFALKAGQRIDETPVHVALRVALINALIHSDYSVGGGIVVERRDEGYKFSNPGTLLVSDAQLRRGGVSECRNKSLQRMFMLIGGGDQAGSGYARIQDGWKSQHWRAPHLTTQHGPDRISLDMPMLSLMPEETFAALRRALGARLDNMSRTAQLALATAAIENTVTNTRMQALVADHPSDITKALRGLVKDGLLVPESQGRWTRYVLPTSLTLTLTPSAIPLDNPAALSQEQVALLIEQTKGRLKPDRGFVEALILHFCHGKHRTVKELAKLMQRKSPARLRDHYLTPMVAQGRLVRLHKEFDHPDQAYRTAGT
jgi:ATP-dependent DNA helicase RecG